MYGLDISKYQSKIDLSKGTYDFAIIKATEGIGYTDSAFHQFAVQLTELNKLIGCYHFARPDLHRTPDTMRKEGDYFVQILEKEGLVGNCIMVLDWEREPMDRPDLIEAWTSQVEKLTGIVPFIYGSRSKLTKWKDYDVIKTHPIWIAVWPNIIRYECGVDPGLAIPNGPVEWDIWQYSSTGKYPGLSGNIDLDYCKFTKEEWLFFAGNNNTESEPEQLSDYMKWAIQIGLFSGYGDGTYRPSNYLTREQAAILFYQFDQYLNNPKQEFSSAYGYSMGSAENETNRK